MRHTAPVMIALALAGCLSDPMEASDESESSSGEETTFDSGSTMSSASMSTTTSATSGSTEDGTSGEDSGSSSGSSSDTETSSSGGSETSTQGLCEFTQQPCTADTDCGIPGICYADTQKCFHWCANDADCPDGLTCFIPGAFGSYCVACGDSHLCAGGAECNSNGDCAEPDHDECDTSGKPCEISEQCVIG